jgi:type IV secretion system protein VirD4
MRQFRDKRISLYLGVSPDDLERVAPIYNLLFQQLIDLNVRELPSGDKHNVRLLLLLDEFTRLGRTSVIASGFSYVAGYGIRLLPVIQNFSQLDLHLWRQGGQRDFRNCGVQIVMRPKEINDAKNVSERLGTYTFRARSRSFGAWGWRRFGIGIRSAPPPALAARAAATAGNGSDRPALGHSPGVW